MKAGHMNNRKGPRLPHMDLLRHETEEPRGLSSPPLLPSATQHVSQHWVTQQCSSFVQTGTEFFLAAIGTVTT